jgi:hypothetical protein
MIKQIKTHLDSLEHWNIKNDDSSQIKSETQFTKITEQLNSFRVNYSKNENRSSFVLI